MNHSVNTSITMNNDPSHLYNVLSGNSLSGVPKIMHISGRPIIKRAVQHVDGQPIMPDGVCDVASEVPSGPEYQ